MFSYGFNNPVMMSDPSGDWPKLSTILTGVAIVAAAVAVTAVVVATVGAASPILLAGGGIIAGGSGASAIAATALTAGGVAATGAVISRSIENKMQPDHTVYKLSDSKGNTQYVGRTKNPVARRNAHANEPEKVGLNFETIASGLNYYEARGLEQIAMLEYNTRNALNRINGISPKNRNIGTYMSAGRDVAHYIGNQISNEILYWTGK